MMLKSDTPVGLMVAAYPDPGAVWQDWDRVTALARQNRIAVEVLVLVRRDTAGTIRERANAYGTVAGSVLGATNGGLLGLIFPPALLPAPSPGATPPRGGLVSNDQKTEIKAEVAHDLAAGSFGIVVMLEARWVADVEKALSRAHIVSVHAVDRNSVVRAEAEAARMEGSSAA